MYYPYIIQFMTLFVSGILMNKIYNLYNETDYRN